MLIWDKDDNLDDKDFLNQMWDILRSNLYVNVNLLSLILLILRSSRNLEVRKIWNIHTIKGSSTKKSSKRRKRRGSWRRWRMRRERRRRLRGRSSSNKKRGRRNNKRKRRWRRSNNDSKRRWNRIRNWRRFCWKILMKTFWSESWRWRRNLLWSCRSGIEEKLTMRDWGIKGGKMNTIKNTMLIRRLRRTIC